MYGLIMSSAVLELSPKFDRITLMMSLGLSQLGLAFSSSSSFFKTVDRKLALQPHESGSI